MLICTSNSTGGVMGKMIDAQSIVVATAATNQLGREADIFKAVLWHSIILAGIVGVMTVLQAYVWPFTSWCHGVAPEPVVDSLLSSHPGGVGGGVPVRRKRIETIERMETNPTPTLPGAKCVTRRGCRCRRCVARIHFTGCRRAVA